MRDEGSVLETLRAMQKGCKERLMVKKDLHAGESGIKTSGTTALLRCFRLWSLVGGQP